MTSLISHSCLSSGLQPGTKLHSKWGVLEKSKLTHFSYFFLMSSPPLTCVTWNRRSLVETSSHVDASKSTQSGGTVLHIHVERGNRVLKMVSIFSNHFPLAHWSNWFWWCILKSAFCIFSPSLSCALSITLKAENLGQPHIMQNNLQLGTSSSMSSVNSCLQQCTVYLEGD